MTLSELHENLHDKKVLQNPKSFISLFEKNLNLIDQADFSRSDEYQCVTELVCEYGFRLVKVGRFKQGIKQLEKAVYWMENNSENIHLHEYPMYEHALSTQAVVLYNKKKYHRCLSIYKKLRAMYSDNEKYQGWIYRVRSRRFEEMSWVGVVLVFVDVALKLVYDSTETNFFKDNYWVMILGILIFLLFELLKRVEKSKHVKLLHKDRAKCSNG